MIRTLLISLGGNGEEIEKMRYQKKKKKERSKKLMRSSSLVFEKPRVENTASELWKEVQKQIEILFAPK